MLNRSKSRSAQRPKEMKKTAERRRQLDHAVARLCSLSEEEAAAMTLAEGLDGKKSIPAEKREQLVVTSESLAQEYPQHASSLLNLIRNSEHAMHQDE